MSSHWRGDVRTWLLLVLALVPTIAVLAAGVWFWSERGREITEFEASLVPVDTTIELSSVSAALLEAAAALDVAAAPWAGLADQARADAAVDQAADSVAASADTIEDLIMTLNQSGSDQSDALSVVGGFFEVAVDVLERQRAGEPTSQEFELLVALTLDNAGGLVLPYTGAGNRSIGFLYEDISASITYYDQLAKDRRAALRALAAGDQESLDGLVGAPLRLNEWKDLLDSRQFMVGAGADVEWQLTVIDADNRPFFEREEPIDVALTDLDRFESQVEQARRLLNIGSAVSTDIDSARGLLDDEIATQLERLRWERQLLAAAAIAVSLVGALLLTLTIAEVRQRHRVEDAHRDAMTQLADKALRDPTTGVWNRRRLEESLAASLTSADRHDEVVVLAYIDLDSFKAINDVWGHHTGDQVLKIVTDRLGGIDYRGVDFELARFGGDEFVLHAQLPAVSLAWLEEFGQNVLDALSDPMEVGSREHSVGASIGITMSAPDSTMDSLLLEADSSLILAKRAKRGSAIVYNREVSRTGELVHALPEALSSGEIMCHLQPVFDTAKGLVSHAEALARWIRPSGEVVSPNVFVPLVESFGLADQLTSTMLRSVGRILADGSCPDDALIWINLSPRELEVANFAKRFNAALESEGVQPERIGLEITETAAVRDPVGLAIELDALRGSGVRIAIDDFGSGYSPLGYLRDLPVDVVKIDRSLIRFLDRDVANQHIVRGVVGMATEFGLSITAEGVERVEEERWLREHGVTHTQGFLRGRPVPPDRFDWDAHILETPGRPAHDAGSTTADGRGAVIG